MKKLYTALVLMLFVLPLVAQNIPSYVPKNGLVGYWPFNGNANDESGNGNNGTVNGATLTVDRNGVSNSAYSFDGVSNYISINNRLLSNSISSFTINLWVDFDTSAQSEIISNRFGQGCGYNYRLFRLNDKLIFGNHIESPWSHDTCTTKLKQNNQWSLISLMYDLSTSKLKLYVNGNFMSSNNSSIWFDGNNPTIIGALFGCYTANPIFFSGQLDDIAIYNRALSEQEVQQLYAGCSKETATSSNFNTLMYTTNAPADLTASPTGGSFSGNGVANNAFNPSKAKLGKNTVKYNFKNTTGCADSTDFAMLVVDTIGATCTKYDTLKVTKFDTVTFTNNVTKYDTVIVKTNVFDTVKVTKYDTLTITNNVTKYDTVKVTKFDTITITNNVTKYDTVKVTKFDTITVTNNVTKYDTVIVNKTNYDTVSILKIKFKLTTGIHANQLSSLSIYPNPTSDVLHIEVPDAKALEGYRYRILDALGKEVYNQLVKQTTTEIPLKTLGAAGVYQFEILDAKNASIQSNKIVLQ